MAKQEKKKYNFLGVTFLFWVVAALIAFIVLPTKFIPIIQIILVIIALIYLPFIIISWNKINKK